MKDLTEQQERRLLVLYDEEWSITELALHFKRPRSLIQKALQEHGQIVETRQRTQGFVPTPLEIEQGATEFREARLKRKRERRRRKRRTFNPSPPAIRVVKVTYDRDGMYLEPV